MSFNSWEFVLFLPCVYALFLIVHKKQRWLVLLLASYFFYMLCVPWYGLLLLTTTTITWLTARQLTNLKDYRSRKYLLVVALVVEFGILAIFKYLLPFIDSYKIMEDEFLVGVILPVGISFYTFKSAGYVIDVYRGIQPAEKGFMKYALFVSYFPQLIAGPIERARNLLPQLNHALSSNRTSNLYALERIAWGFFKKVVIADNIKQFVDHTLSLPQEYTGLQVYLTLLYFSIQILADFSGYCDIAIGTSSLFGIKLSENFNRPYLTTSLSGFWNSWNLTLTHWVRDYIYYPLNKGTISKWLIYFNTFLTFFIIGIWHGASLNFILFGIYNGVIIVLEHLIKLSSLNNKIGKTPTSRSLFIIKNYHVILIGSMLFCTTDFSQSLALLEGLFVNWNSLDILNGYPIFDLALTSFLVCIYILLSFIRSRNTQFDKRVILIILLVLIYFFGVGHSPTFYYFQF